MIYLLLGHDTSQGSKKVGRYIAFSVTADGTS